MSARRTLFIGDVHGCAEELRELLDGLAPTPEDDILFIGDLINKGPDSVAVWHEYRRIKARAVMGNHERGLLQMATGAWGKGNLYWSMKKEFGTEFEAFLKDIQSWPYWMETPDYIAVHAGFLPDRPIEQTSESQLCTLRMIADSGMDKKEERPWFERYEGEKLVVFGHWAALGGIVRANVIGLDTGCVYGGRLTALELPSRQLFSVPARKIYAPIR